MLSRHERLRHQRDFDELRQHGRSYHQPLLRLTVLKEDSARQLTGFIVSKRISKKAVKRNLIKRRLRAAYRSLKQDIPPGCVLLFVARPATLDVTYADLVAQMRSLLEKAGLFGSKCQEAVAPRRAGVSS